MSTSRVGQILESLVGSRTPGISYTALGANGPLLQYNLGSADIRHQRCVDAATTWNAYSMSKTITAAAALVAVQNGLIGLDDPMERFIGSTPYGPLVTVRQLLAHTSGLPNPIPLRWVHAASDRDFDESRTLSVILKRNRKLAAHPGERYAYSNLGYWVLGEIVAQAAGCSFPIFVREHVLRPLQISESDLSYVILDPTHHANGYLDKYSVMNLMKWCLIDRRLIGPYEGNWLRIEPHYVNGPAFGGLIGTIGGFELFLRDQLRSESVLFGDATRALFYEQQHTLSGRAIPMTCGWHMGSLGHLPYYFKEGGGAGFHCMMRVYRSARIATIVMANATGLHAGRVLDSVDRLILR